MLTSESLNSWRRVRRASHEALTKRVIQNYHPIQMKEATILVSSLLKHSTDHKQDGHLKRVVASTILSIVYDYPTLLSDHDYVVEGIEKITNHLTESLIMGSYFVDIFPWMKHIPERFEFRYSFIVITHRQYKLALQNGSGTGCEYLPSALRCFSVFSIVSKLTSYVLIFSASSGALLTDNKGRWGRQAKLLCIIDTEF